MEGGSANPPHEPYELACRSRAGSRDHPDLPILTIPRPGKTFRVQGAPGYASVVMGCAITAKGCAMLSALIGVLIIVVIGAICFWAIDKFAVDRRLAQLLRLLVVLICIAAILQRVLPLLGVYI
jgi:hypothetical protein